MQEIKGKKRIFKGFLKTGIATLILIIPFLIFEERFLIGLDQVRGMDCLPYGIYLIDTYNKKIVRGDYVAFKTNQMSPFYPDGQKVVKIAAGVPGDKVITVMGSVSVAGKEWGKLYHLLPGARLNELGRKESDYDISRDVEQDELWMMASHPRSYDSRYWGPIKQDQVIGRAYPLW